MSRFVLCDCPAGFAADPERHAPDCPGRSGAGKPSLLPPGKPIALIAAGPAPTPRPGREYWDQLCRLPRYMFLLRPSGSGVQKLEDPTGNWLDAHEAQKVVEAAQDDLNAMRAELYLAYGREAVLTARLEQKITEIIDEATKAIDSYRKEAALQERLNIAEQRVDDLETEARALRKDVERYRVIRDQAWYIDQFAYVYDLGNSRSPWSWLRASVDADDVEAVLDAAIANAAKSNR